MAPESIELARPIPTSGSATVTTRISEIWDKGKAAVIWQEGVATSPIRRTSLDHPLVDLRQGRGRLGRRPRHLAPVELPDRAPDADTTYDVTPQQAMLYRLCGDRNPLHADPDFAQAAGFPAPILHGLCSYGIVLRTSPRLLGGDATRVGASPRSSPAWSSRARR